MTDDFKNAPNTVDAIIEKNNKLLMIRRGKEPFKGKLALSGGFVNFGERVEEAVIREVKEELGVEANIDGLLGVYSGMDRDPRGPIISTVFICNINGNPTAGDDADDYEWIDLANYDDHEFAFDHKKIISDYIKWKNTGDTYWSSK